MYFSSDFLFQKVFLLPKTVLAMVDCEAFNGQAYCYRENKGWYWVMVHSATGPLCNVKCNLICLIRAHVSVIHFVWLEKPLQHKKTSS